MAKRKPMQHDPCPVARSADVIGDRWCLLLVRDLFDGIHRFSDLQRSLGVARNILADRLRRLVEADILAIQPAADGSSYQEYILTARGMDLFPLVVALRQWGEQHLFSPGEAHSQLVEKTSGQPVQALALYGRDGHRLTPGETLVRKLPAL